MNEPDIVDMLVRLAAKANESSASRSATPRVWSRQRGNLAARAAGVKVTVVPGVAAAPEAPEAR